MTNTRAFIYTGILAFLSFMSWVTVETPFAEKHNLSNGLLYTLCAAFGILGAAIIVRQFHKQ